MTIEKQTFKSGPLKDLFAQAVKVGNIIYLSGQVGSDAAEKAGSNLLEQTELAYSNIKKILAEFGATMDNIVDETMFVTSVDEVRANFREIFEIRTKAYGGPAETCMTLIGVASLAAPDFKIEIKCIAHL